MSDEQPPPQPPAAPTPRAEPSTSSFSARFRLGPVPVEVHVSVVVLLAFLGLGFADLTVVTLFVVIGLLSLLLHELGHAVVARMAGCEPRIQLAGLGGVTRYEPTEKALRRGWRVAVALAGPVTGLASWALLVAVQDAWAPVTALPNVALEIATWMALIWSLFNLLPILPLDGAQALMHLLPGDERTRARRTAIVGVLVGGGVILWALVVEQVFVALFIGFTVFRNVQLARALGERRPGRPTDGGPSGPDDTPADPLAEAVRGHRWAEVGERLRAGEGSPTQAADAVRAAANANAHTEVVALVELTAALGMDDPRLAWQAARSQIALGRPVAANEWVRRALVDGADPDAVAADPALAPARATEGWPLRAPTDD